MDTLEINVRDWPSEWVDTVKKYTDELTAKFEGNALRLPATPKAELPKWPGVARSLSKKGLVGPRPSETAAGKERRRLDI